MCRRSGIRRLSAIFAQPSVRLSAVACSWCRFCDAQQGVLLPALPELADDRQHPDPKGIRA
jgi:hypothetical protein